MKLERVLKLTGEIYCVGNLHIGGSKDTIEIGGVDNPVIKHPISGEPYIPGSSLKGKMRCSVERKAGKGDVCKCGERNCRICVVFGSIGNGAWDRDNKRSRPPLGPTRLIVRDAPLTAESRERMQNFVRDADKSYMGIKFENSIRREVGTALNPRQAEFVPSDTSFALNISLLEYDIDRDKNYLDFVKEALRMVEDTYLGGYGSRGYGQVEFRNLMLDGKPLELR